MFDRNLFINRLMAVNRYKHQWILTIIDMGKQNKSPRVGRLSNPSAASSVSRVYSFYIPLVSSCREVYARVCPAVVC